MLEKIKSLYEEHRDYIKRRDDLWKELSATKPLMSKVICFSHLKNLLIIFISYASFIKVESFPESSSEGSLTIIGFLTYFFVYLIEIAIFMINSAKELLT